MSRGGRLVAAALGAVAARCYWSMATRLPVTEQARWQRSNHRGEPITLLAGPTAAAALATTALIAPGLPARARLAGAVAAMGAGGVGVFDDLAERGASKGLRGHLGALRRGELTTGAIKIVGLAGTGIAVAALARPRARSVGPLTGLVMDGALIAGAANLANLLDLRPGRCLKAGLLATPAALSAHPAGALVAMSSGVAAALLPEDLAEQSMLGDGGANSLGAVLGAAVVARGSRPARVLTLAALVALTLASEKVSFTAVIEKTPGLRELDALGRRPR